MLLIFCDFMNFLFLPLNFALFLHYFLPYWFNLCCLLHLVFAITISYWSDSHAVSQCFLMDFTLRPCCNTIRLSLVLKPAQPPFSLPWTLIQRLSAFFYLSILSVWTYLTFVLTILHTAFFFLPIFSFNPHVTSPTWCAVLSAGLCAPWPAFCIVMFTGFGFCFLTDTLMIWWSWKLKEVQKEMNLSHGMISSHVLIMWIKLCMKNMKVSFSVQFMLDQS